MVIEFFIPMIPPTITAQQHKVAVVNGKPRFFDPPELSAAKIMLESRLAAHRPQVPADGPLRLLVKWCFPTAGKHRDGEYRISRPDTDNLQKALKDCMTKLRFWVDDARVASEIVEKFWAELPGIYIRIEELKVDGN